MSALEKFIHNININYASLKAGTVFALLFTVSFLVRFPFFFRDYIDRDESTFILMGQSWVNGNLPYTELWDLKPPITYLFFAGIIYAFGKSFFAIRLIGALIIAFTAFCTYKTALGLTSKKVAFWAAIGCVCLLSMFGSLQGVMSEHICMFFFMPGLYLLIKPKGYPGYLFSGLFMGLALMTKLNMAYVVLALGLYIFWYSVRSKSASRGVLKVFFFGLGALLIVVATFLPYYTAGIPRIWWNSVIMAALEYSNTGDPLTKFLPITLFMGIFFYVGFKKKWLDLRNQTVVILTFTLMAIVFTFIKGGRLNGHYLIQMHPTFIILFTLFISKITFLKKTAFKKIYLLILFLLPAESYLEYYRIIVNKIEKGSFYNGEGITVPEYIVKNNIATDKILFLEYHIGYWLLDQNPPTKAATHPSNICRSQIFPFFDNPRKTGLEEIQYIMEELQPKTVVIRKNRALFDPKLVDENRYVNTYIGQNYDPPITVDQAEIFLRSER